MANNMDVPIFKILFFSDTHLGFDFPLRPRVEKERRGQDFFRNFETVLNTALTEKVDAIIHGGDLFFRSKVSPVIVEKTFKSFHKIADSGIPIYLVPGNHERSWIPQTLFHQHKNIHIFDSPRTFRLSRGPFSINLSGFPNMRNGIRRGFPEILQKINSSKNSATINILCFHQSVEGATVGPQNYTFKNDPDTIACKDIPNDYDIILSGHIHRHQIISKNSRGIPLPSQILYSGSTERTSFAEKDEDKGYIKLEFKLPEGRKKETFKWSFVKLKTRPMSKLYLNLDELQKVEKLSDFLNFQFHQFPANANIQVKIGGTQNEEFVKKVITKTKEIIPGQMILSFSKLPLY